jgi:ABC-type antimicrobial peptide transport system permease subunit
LRNEDFFYLVQAEGRPPAAGETLPRVEFRSANQDFFRAAGISLLRGRYFSSTDERVLIVNKAFADKFFPGEDPIGKRVGFKADWQPDSLHWFLTIVGVVANTRDGSLDADPRLVAFEPLSRMPSASAGFVIRVNGPTLGLAAQATRIVRRIAPAALIENVMTIAQFRRQTVSPQRLNAGLITSFGALAVIIAAVGIGGVLAFAVSARTNEIGIRMSLGADSGRVQRMILREGGTLVAIGLVLGVMGAYFSAGVIRGLLFGVTPNDPMTYASVGVTMAAIGIFACWIPARRAARIDPAIAMRA